MTSSIHNSTVLELFHALKPKLSSIASDYISNSAGLNLQEVISWETEASDILSSVRFMKNCASPAGRLPPKILERIISMRASTRDLIRAWTKDLIRASHVCRHWRNTLVSSPRLWTDLECIHVGLTLQQLARSEPSPLNVITDYKSTVRAVRALQSGVDRLRSLTLHLRHDDLLEVFPVLSARVPILEHLKVSVDYDLTNMRASIPESFLGSSTPALKSLHLENINTKLNFSKFPALTRLTLITSSGYDIFHVSELFQIFRSAELLEEVSVEFCCKEVIVEHESIVHLPRIRKLSFSNSSGGIFPTGLLSPLEIPCVEEVKLSISLGPYDTRTMGDFSPPHLLEADSLELGVHYPSCNILLRRPGRAVSINAQGGYPGEEFLYRWLGPLDPRPMANVKDLTLKNYTSPTGDPCPVLEFLKSMDRLRSLTLKQCKNDTIMEKLSPSKEGNIWFPQLESLTLWEPTSVFPSLTDMARARGNAGFPLSTVSFYQRVTTFGFSSPNIDSLKSCVGRVQIFER